VVPKQAVQEVAGLRKVFVIRNGRAVECKLSPGEEMEGWVEARGADVRAGERVAVSNLGELVDGAPVTSKEG
jgi:hypothetical protein